METEEKKTVWGKVEFFIYHPVQFTSHEKAIQAATDMLNNKTVRLLDGNIHTIDGKILPVVVDKLNITWIDTVGEYEL